MRRKTAKNNGYERPLTEGQTEEISKCCYSKKCDLVQKDEKSRKSKNNLKSHLRALNKELWLIESRFENLKFYFWWKQLRSPRKNQTSWKFAFRARKDKNVKSKNQLKTRLGANDGHSWATRREATGVFSWRHNHIIISTAPPRWNITPVRWNITWGRKIPRTKLPFESKLWAICKFMREKTPFNQ